MLIYKLYVAMVNVRCNLAGAWQKKNTLCHLLLVLGQLIFTKAQVALGYHLLNWTV